MIHKKLGDRKPHHFFDDSRINFGTVYPAGTDINLLCYSFLLTYNVRY